MMKKCYTSLSLSIMILVASAISSLAFSNAASSTRPMMQKCNILKLFSTLEPFAVDSIDETRKSLFNPIGPPDFLSNLPVGESIYVHGKNITRLSSSPDIFLIKAFVSSEDRTTLIQSAQTIGMKIAGTKQSGENTVRKNSYLTWIDPFSLVATEGDSDWKDAPSIVRDIIAKCRLCFVHDTLNDAMNNANVEYCFAEDLQVAKYDEDGRFDYHHDGYSRYLTVLTYLNGIGGTYFPFGGMARELEGIDFTNEDEVSVLKFKRELGDCGILIAGEEGPDAYLQSAFIKPRKVVNIEAGDSLAFYSYTDKGEKDLRSMHCSLPVPSEKWISTAWFRSEALTGPFSSFKKAKLFEG